MFIGKPNPLFKSALLLLLLCQLTISQSKLSSLLPEIEATILKSRQNIWKEMQPDGLLWNMPPWLGTFFLSQYYFELKVFELDQDAPFVSQFDEGFFTAKLLREQLPDGSWKQLNDENRKEGLLDATIFNYWYLKEVGTDMLSPAMMAARKFILDHGGLEKSQIMTKYKLAAFGQYQWQLLNYIPLFLFKDAFPLYSYGYIKDYVSQWVYPHLTALAYLRYHKTIFPVSKVCLSELMTTRGNLPCEAASKDYLLKSFNKFNGSEPLAREPDVDNILDEAIRLTGPREAYGGYTISTLLNLMSLKDYTLRYNTTNNALVTHFQRNYKKSLEYVESLYFVKRVPYEGCLCDGRFWDTILMSFALLQSGEYPEKLHPVVENLVVNKLQENGGIPYGQEFQYAPDIDDTGMLMAVLGKMKQHYKGTSLFQLYSQGLNKTYNWVKSNQNKDGGFPAFDKDKNDDQYPLIKFIFWLTKIDKSAEIFDPSCPDIVGHILEGFGQANIGDKQVLVRSIEYLYNNRKQGMWSARWGINYVYAVGAVYPGLAKIGYNMSEQWIMNITKRLVEVQQSDGGFGQDSQGYNVKRYVKGVTTASMTAWGLLAYIEAAHTIDIDDNIYRAAKYLLDNFKENGDKFWDRSVVGAGHRGILNLQYPVYAFTFPLVALSRLRDLIKGEKKPYVNPHLMTWTKNVTLNNNNEL